jgi:hypothetical protein
MTLHGRAALLAASIAVVAAAPRGAAAAGRKVVFVAASPTPFSARVRAEIEAMGFEVEAAADLSEEGTAAVAAARVLEDRRVELWIANSAGGRLMLRAVVVPSPDDDYAIETVRASEQLRAFFQRLRVVALPSPEGTKRVALAAAAPSPSQVEAPAAAPPEAPLLPLVPALEPVEALRPRFVVGAAFAVPFQPGGPGFDVEIRGRWMAAKVLGVGAFVEVPVAGSTVRAAEGSATISAPLLGADLSVVGNVGPRVRLSGTAGLALAWVRTSGFANAPYYGQPSDVAAALALLGAGVAPRLTGRIHACLDGRVGISVPRVDIAFVGRPVATWGRPLGLLSGGVSVDL